MPVEIFDREDFARLKAAQRQLNDCIPVCDAAEACGCNMDAQRQLIKDLQSVLEALQVHFFTPPPE